MTTSPPISYSEYPVSYRTRSRSSATKPNCTKGFSCKNACVAKGRNCRNPLDGQFKTYGEWLQDAVTRGTPLSDSHKQEAETRGIRATPTPAPTEQRRNRNELPRGVSRETTGRILTYEFRVGSNDVEVGFYRKADENGKVRRSVSFSIDGSFGIDRSAISDEQRSQISRKIFAVLRHQMAQEEDGTEYECSAWNDEQGSFRALAYVRAGFSRPSRGLVGYGQYAVINGGKIDPQATEERLKREESFSFHPGLYQTSQERWDRLVEAEMDDRRRQREERRSRRS